MCRHGVTRKMLKNITFLLITFIVNVTSLPNPNKDVNDRRYTEVDILLEHIQQEWHEDVSCREIMLEMLYGVKNSTLWASWIWDSMQRPTGKLYGSRYQLGNYDQCLNPPWKSSHPHLQTQYCLVDIKYTDKELKERSGLLNPYGSMEYYIETKNENGRSFNTLTMGVCVPAACGARAALLLASVLASLPAHKGNSGAVHCQTSQHYEWKFYAFIGMFAVLTLLALSSTYYLKLKQNIDESKPDSWASMAKFFCLVTNLKDLTKVNNEEIRILNGMRFITAVITVIMHEILCMITNSLSNGLDLDEDIRNRLSWLFHMDVVIDTFFAMSGLLFMKGLLTNKNQNLLVTMMKRYVRLIGPYAVMTLYIVSVYKVTGSGPLWTRFSSFETHTCSKYWWLNFLMINSDYKRTLCYTVTWYISADYQLAMLATVIFYLYRRNNKAGFITFLTAFALAAFIPGVLTYWNNYPTMSFDQVIDILTVRNKLDFNQVYIKSYSRAGAYLVGVAMGYIMTSYKPQMHRNLISKVWSYIGSVIAIITLFSVISLGAFFANRKYDPLEAAISMAFNRSVWAIAICCLIALSEYGCIPYITNFLGWKVFVPLSKLSYGIYVIHPVIFQKKYFSIRNPLQFDYFDILVDVLGVIVLSLFFSLSLYLLVENPLIKLSNHFLSTRCKQNVKSIQTQNGYASRNGHGESSHLHKID